MITLQKLRIFVLVCEQGSFNKASQALYLTQSAVSQHIQDLEATLGTSLVTRSPQGTIPTPAGKILLDYARQVTALIEEAERTIIQLDQAESQQLALSATPGVSVYLLPGWLRRFQDTYSKINVSMQTDLTRQVVSGVMDTRFDLGFIEGELSELDNEALGKVILDESHYDLVVSENHAWAKRESVSLAELSTQPYINRQPTSRTRKWLENALSTHTIRLNTTTELDSPGTIKYALLNGSGVAILPRYAIEREVARGELHRIKIKEMALSRPLQLLWNSKRPFNAVQRAFLGQLADSAPVVRGLL